MARNFQSTDVSVLYRYMGDSIPLCKLPAFPQSYVKDTTTGQALSRQELALRIRADRAVLKSIQDKTGITAVPTSIVSGIGTDGTGYMYLDFATGTDMSKWTVPYMQEAGRRKRLQNVSLSYWSKEAKDATGLEVMPTALAEQVLHSIESLIHGYCNGAAAMHRWELLVSNAQNGIQALKQAGIPETDATFQALLKQAHTPRPSIKQAGKSKVPAAPKQARLEALAAEQQARSNVLAVTTGNVGQALVKAGKAK